MHRLTEVLTPVRRQENESTAFRPVELLITVIVAHGCFQRVNRRISGNVDGILRLAFPDEISFGKLGRREIIFGYNANRLSVELFRIR